MIVVAKSFSEPQKLLFLHIVGIAQWQEGEHCTDCLLCVSLSPAETGHQPITSRSPADDVAVPPRVCSTAQPPVACGVLLDGDPLRAREDCAAVSHAD